MTNADKIRQMNDEELLEWLDSIGNACMSDDTERCDDYEDCRECWKDWLRSSANTQENHHAN